MESKENVINRLIIQKAPAIEKLLVSLRKYNITFQPNDGVLANIVFTKDEIDCKIAYEVFYRYSGRCACVNADGKVEQIDDKAFYEWVKMLILFSLKIEYV